MAARSPLGRDRRGRFITAAEELERINATLELHRAWRPSAAHILANPTNLYPRWRLRVFDLCWPWRASVGEAIRDAIASGNARRDLEDRAVYLDCVANLQRDPPHYVHGYRLRQRRRAAGDPPVR